MLYIDHRDLTKAVFTLDAQAVVSGHWHKIVFLSDTECCMHPRVQSRDLVPGNAQGAPILVGELEKKVCSHWCSARIILRHPVGT